MSQLDYKSAGVDLDIYEQSMRNVARHIRGTRTPRVIPLEGGFAGLFHLFGDGKRYRDPVIVSGTDGVGTKLKLAQMMQRFDTIGIDLVAMCVNDCLCTGAEPLFFLDYLAMGRDDAELTEQLVRGIATGCQQTGMALIGGETAIMPDVYGADDFDLAGFCIGVVERDEVINGQAVQPGDRILGLASSGFHSNGYSLIRKVIFEHAGLRVDQPIPDLQTTVGEALLTPTRLYPSLLSPLLTSPTLRPAVHAIAHITGGGLSENLSRVLPAHVTGVIEQSAWNVPPLFTWLQQLGKIDLAEMRRVFNQGIGLVLVVDADSGAAISEALRQQEQTVFELGEIRTGTGGVTILD